jgi:hypothetical protein
MSTYGRTVQVVITIQSTTLEPEAVAERVRHKLSQPASLLVEGDTVSSYYVDCECKYCTAEVAEV